MQSKDIPERGRSPVSRWLVAVAAVVAAVVVAGCGLAADTPAAGELGELQRLEEECGATAPAVLVQLDVSGSSDDQTIAGERLAGVEAVARETAVCGGRLRVVAFSASSAATVALFDDSLEPSGATTNARLRRVPELVEAAMGEIRSAYDDAVVALPDRGSDVVGQLRLAAEWHGQLGGDYQLRVTVFTDGFQTAGVDLNDEPLSVEEAAALAEDVVVPELPGATVTFAGLGQVVGDPPASATVEGLVAFYDALCARTSAAVCTSVTDYATAR